MVVVGGREAGWRVCGPAWSGMLDPTALDGHLVKELPIDAQLAAAAAAFLLFGLASLRERPKFHAAVVVMQLAAITVWIAVIVSVLVGGATAWPVLPVAVVGILAAATDLRAARRERRPLILEGFGSGFLLLAGVFSLLLVALFPVRFLPTPVDLAAAAATEIRLGGTPAESEPGTRPIGTTVHELVHDDLLEPYGEAAGTPRRIAFQVWYPAADIGEPVAWTRSSRAFSAAAIDEGLPPFLLAHFGRTDTLATLGADLATIDGDLTVVLMSHGWTGWRQAQLAQAQALAARGVVVVAVDHTSGSRAAEFPDAEVIPLVPAALPEGDTRDEAGAQLEAVFAADLAEVLDEVAEIEGTPWSGRLALDRLAVLGHSTGGGGAITFCATSTRCAAMALLDPWIVPVPDDLVASGPSVPTLVLNSAEWADGRPNDVRIDRWLDAASAEFVRGTVARGHHGDFTDVSQFSPLSGALLGGANRSEGLRMLGAIDAQIAAFLAATVGLPDVDVAVWDPPDTQRITFQRSGTPG